MRLLPLLVACAGLLAHWPALASDDQRFIGFECSPELGLLRISYHVDRLQSPFAEGELIDTFRLKQNDSSGERVLALRNLRKTCRIGGTLYVVQLRGIPGNWNLNGRCGGLTFGGARVSVDGRTLFDGDFETCDAGRQIAAVGFAHGSREAQVVAAH